MFDIFSDEKEQPSLYIADINIKAVYPTRKGSKKMESMVIKLEKTPIVLLDGDFPTHRNREHFLKRVHDKYLANKKYEMVKFTILNIENMKFSSKLAYKFDYDTH